MPVGTSPGRTRATYDGSRKKTTLQGTEPDTADRALIKTKMGSITKSEISASLAPERTVRQN